MFVNPLLGVGFHWLGGLASGSFYLPFRGVRRWSWETAWLVSGVASWLIMPWTMALLLSNDVLGTLRQCLELHGSAVMWTYAFGVLWGIGGLSFGLTMRYLGMSLGMAVALGNCSIFGTLMPPIFTGQFDARLMEPVAGHWVLGGLAIGLIGIGVAGLAGIRKEWELSDEQKRAAVAEFSFKKGIWMAFFSGIMSSCFSFGLNAAEPICRVSVEHGTAQHWSGLPALIVILLGGFTSNAVWCGILHWRNGSTGEYARRTTIAGGSALLDEHGSQRPAPTTGVVSVQPVPLLRNYAFSAMAGIVWYLQFFFYTMGESMMGDYRFTSWTLHMSSIIIFSSLWGIVLKEWRGVRTTTFRLLIGALVVLIVSTIVIGYGNQLAQRG